MSSILVVGLLFGLIAIPVGPSYASLSKFTRFFASTPRKAPVVATKSPKEPVTKKHTPSEEEQLWQFIKKHAYEQRVPPNLLAAIARVNKNEMGGFRYSKNGVGIFNLKSRHFRRAGIPKSTDLNEQTKVTAVTIGELLAYYEGNKRRAIAAFYQGTKSVPRDRMRPLSKGIRLIVNNVIEQEEKW